jgi:hypothetical protein
MEGTVSQFAGIYHEWAPHPSLRGHVRRRWINDLSGSRNECLHVVPDGCVYIVCTADPARKMKSHPEPRRHRRAMLLPLAAPCFIHPQSNATVFLKENPWQPSTYSV